MDDRRLGRAVRAQRHRRGWRQKDLARRAGVSAGLVGLLERGRADRLTVRSVRAVLRELDVALGWDLGWQRMEVDRLLDADHAALSASLAAALSGVGWEVRGEVSFNEYGDRGRIDLLGYHAALRVVLVVEVKTSIVDAQAMLGALDVKTRLGRRVAQQLGWPHVGTVVPMLAVAEGTTARRHLTRLEPLLGRFELRGRAAMAWLRTPERPATGLLVLIRSPHRNGVDVRRAGRQRVRTASGSSRSRAGRKTP